MTADTITIAGVEMKRDPVHPHIKYDAADGRSYVYADERGCFCVLLIGKKLMDWRAPTLDALDARVRAALAEAFRALLPFVPDEVERIRREEQERCEAVIEEARYRFTEDGSSNADFLLDGIRARK